MNYEQKYKDALERAKQALKDGTITNTAIAHIQDIFPELKESCGNRIKNLIYCLIRDSSDNRKLLEHNGTTVEEALAWLEKQGQVKESFVSQHEIETCKENDVSLTSEDERIRRAISQCIEDMRGQFEKLYNVHHKDALDWLEKQGEKPQGKTALEAVNEEKVDNQNCVKPADKVEPKFHKNDWIIHQGTDNIYQVVACINNQYQLKYGDNYTLQKFTDVDRCARLWTIKDAKDGDILSSGQIILLFKEWECSDCNFVIAYAGIDVSGKLQITDKHWLISNCALPATKEQRDALTKAMTDAGYTFNFEKKELKKISNKIEIPFDAKDSELQEATYYIPKGFHAEIDDDKVVIKKGEKPNEWKPSDWIDIKERPLEFGEEVIGYNKAWIDEDFNLNGTRIGFLSDYGDDEVEGQINPENPKGGPSHFCMAKWCDYHDCYHTMYGEVGEDGPNMPTHYMLIPKHP